MGVKGFLPHRKIEPRPLADKNPPEWLGTLGREHWDRHIDYLTKNNLVDASTADAFAVLCDLYEKVRTETITITSYTAAVKLYTQFAKTFRLLPIDPPGVQQVDRFEGMPVFKPKELSA